MSNRRGRDVLSVMLGAALGCPVFPPKAAGGPAGQGTSVNETRPPSASAARPCALIETDDDVPSGSATAGALYVPDAALGKELLTKDAVATAQGFLDAGLRCVIVVDSHDGAIDPGPLKALGPQVSVATPSTERRWTWPFLGNAVERASVAALIGFHSRAGQVPGFRPHTINDTVRELRINGAVVGEVAHSMLGLSAFDVPVVMVSGDMNATGEAAALVPSVEQVAVRWQAPDGSTRFLTSSEASQRLREAARRGATSKIPCFRPSLPISVGLKLHSASLMAERSRSLSKAFVDRATAGTWDRGLLGDFGFDGTLRVEGNLATWSAPNALAAFLSIAVAASHLRAADNWELVSRGYDAYRNGKHEEAILAYGEALQANAHDVATRCRMAAAHQKLGQVERARVLFRFGVDHDDEIGDVAMRSWCALGLAQTELASHNLQAARDAAHRVLALPDLFGRHEDAKKVLAETDRQGP